MAQPIVIDNGAGTSSTRLSDFNTGATTHTYDGVISGNGSYRRSASVAGTGGLTIFTAANTYTGSTAINDGTLQLGNGGTTGSLSASSVITTQSSGVFRIDRSNAVTQGTDFSGAAISGAGSLVKDGTGTLTLNVANTFTGNVTINKGTVVATTDGALGGGNISLTAGGVNLTLQGAFNNYISDNKSLSLVDGSTVSLDQTGGSDTIAGLVLGSLGAQAAPGTYGSSASGAMFQFDAYFTGTGTLTLVPEPSTWVMIGSGIGLLGGFQILRRKRS
jgi:autotransporter-associated beta strand protein